MPRATAYAHRSIDRVFNFYGTECRYIRPDGTLGLSGQIGKFDVIDAEENIEGARIETDIKGYRVRFRTWHLPDGFAFEKGGRLHLREAFDGYCDFIIDAMPRSFNRGGYQIVMPLQPYTGPAPSAPTGYDFGDA